MALRTREKCRKVAAELMNKKDLFVLGKGYAEPIAFEGALKIKEMCYLHAEGFSGTYVRTSSEEDDDDDN